jgi:hypothetical protein
MRLIFLGLNHLLRLRKQCRKLIVVIPRLHFVTAGRDPPKAERNRRKQEYVVLDSSLRTPPSVRCGGQAWSTLNEATE